ncbi:response regulator transcription factor [Clostridium transplantifaecale]|uniref:response regulator transcription factor n=1 Tax=Clostridium transplantifaecale TaxID=2479838 RepID=UPI000F6447EF|nr:response regulator transcription factor [Clostridium transplantifaecale]
MNKILIVDDDEQAVKLEREHLEAEGYEVKVLADSSHVVGEVKTGRYCALLLEVVLPVGNGFELCRKVRVFSDIPILLVTVKEKVEDKIRGLTLGADDYISKPFSPAEMVARVRTHIQIHNMLLEKRDKKEADIEIGQLKILPKERRVYVKGKEKILSNKEFELLLYFAQNIDAVISKDTLLEKIWGEKSTDKTATVTVHINRLRVKIEKKPNAPRYIQTIWGAGYRFRSM